MMNKKILITLLVAAVCVGAVLSLRMLRQNPEEILKARIAERSLGSEKAPIWITEYFDYQCPPCANARVTLEKMMADHPGQIYLQARFFPLPAHKNGMRAAIFAECASRQKGKFWKFHEEMLSHQKEWAEDVYASFKFTSYAESAGLDLKKLEACAQDPETEKSVAEEKKKAEALGVAMTPSFYVNGKLAVGVTALAAEIQAATDKAKTS